MPKGILFHFIRPIGVLKVVSKELSGSNGTCQKAVLISAGENYFSIANVCDQMIDSWDWVLRSFECRVQWSAVYAESNSILSRRFVYNCRSTY